MQAQLFDIPLNQNDTVYTPDPVARLIVDYFNPTGLCLDPCKGEGAFLRYLPPGSDWCEIEEGKDFFAHNRRVDWIVGNPPYSIYYEWLVHSFKIANNIVYLVPTHKCFSSYRMFEAIRDFGGVKEVLVLGTGRTINLPFGFAVGAVHYQRGYTGDTRIGERRVLPESIQHPIQQMEFAETMAQVWDPKEGKWTWVKAGAGG